jgi:hypothetical protein
MKRAFIYLPPFEKELKNIGLSRDSEIDIEQEILNNPVIGKVMKGTGGVRKFRKALPNANAGKSGGVRIVYVDFPMYGKVYLMELFSKNEKENLTKEERNDLKKLVALLEIEAKRGVK